MRLKIIIDAIYHEIDSTDPETLGRWIVEIFGRVKYPTPATMIQVQAYPSFTYNDQGQFTDADWITDSRWLGQFGTCLTPRELVDQLGKWLDEYEAERDGNAGS